MSAERRRGLGRGLGALIPTGPEKEDGVGLEVADDRRSSVSRETAAASSAQNGIRPSSALDQGASVEQQRGSGHRQESEDGLRDVPGARFAEIVLTDIRPNPRQPRTVFDPDELDELVTSIREIGVLQPIVVRAVVPGQGTEEDPDGHARFELVMGERRWRASQEAGEQTIPAIIRETTDDDLLRDALLENLHRSQLNPLEEAAAYQQLLDDFACTHEELAQRIGRSRPQISNTLRLLKLPPLVARRLAAGVLNAGHARALLGLDDPAAMERLAQRIVAEGLSVRNVEEIITLGAMPMESASRRRARSGPITDGRLEEVATALSNRLDTRVSVVMGQRKGRLTVEFASVEDLDRIMKVLEQESTQRGSK